MSVTMKSKTKWSTGELIFLQSRNPAVFNQRTVIRWVVGPKKGQAFIFMRPGDASPSNTSTLVKTTRFPGGLVLNTLNSAYVLLEDSDD